MATTPHPDKDSLIRLLRQHHDGEPWHGPSRAALLEGVTAQIAAWHPGAGAHSIWETVLHMRSWTDEVRERALGKVPDRTAEPVGGDWPRVTDTSEAGWRAAVASLDEAHARLLAAVAAMTDAQLAARVGVAAGAPEGTGIRVRTMLRSLAEHDVYHCGQLSLLKRLARAALGLEQ